MIPAALLLIISFFSFIKLIIFFTCSLKNSQNFFMQSLPLYTSCLFSEFLNEDIVDIEKPDGICLSTFVVHEFSVLTLHSSIFSIIHSRSAQIINKECFIRYLILIKFYYFSVFRRHNYLTKNFIFAYIFM